MKNLNFKGNTHTVVHRSSFVVVFFSNTFSSSSNLLSSPVG